MKWPEIDGPRWKDECGHDGYVGTLEIGKETLDICVFENGRFQSVCLRFGPEGHQYHSIYEISHLFDILHEPFISVGQFLKNKGSIRWTPNP